MTGSFPATPLRILVVDDDADSRFLCKRLLERLGHFVRVAEEGIEAIGLLRDGSWDVVLSDQNLPGATGVDVLERAHRLQPSARRILMSTLLDPQVKKDAQERGRVHAYIEKRFDRSAFAYSGAAILVSTQGHDPDARAAEG